MKRFFLFLIVAILATSCCDQSECKYSEGDDVKIKNNLTHNTATVTDVRCGCKYKISYHTLLGIKRYRTVEEYELICF